MANQILGFFDDYRFLSNFHEHPEVKITISGFAGLPIECKNVEAAFAASKTIDIEERTRIAESKTPGEAKKMGRAVTLRPDWEAVKIDVMLELLTQKFSHPYYRDLLKATGDAYLEETNLWGDHWWGVCYGVGENHLGKLLMQIREVL